MVVLRVTRLTYTPLEADGFRRFRSDSSASTFCFSLDGSKSTLPTEAWMMPFLSVRKRT
ncbi:hypothetical protein D3C71_2115140 [compost metagenome]